MTRTHQWVASTAIAFAAALSGTAQAADTKVEVIAELQQQPGNPAVDKDGTVYLTMHPMGMPKYKLVRLVDGRPVPFPTEQVSSEIGEALGIHVDSNNILWWLDMGGLIGKGKLVAWELDKNLRHAEYEIDSDKVRVNSFLQDFVIDEKHKKAFIADTTMAMMKGMSHPAFIVIDLKSGETRRVLDSDTFLQPSEVPVNVGGKPVKAAGETLSAGLNPIAIDPDFEWVYFGAMNPGQLMRIKAETLGDPSKTNEELHAAIEVFSSKPGCDGIAAAGDEKIYLTDVDKNAISLVTKDSVKTWAQSDDMVWPDGIFVAKDGAVYVSASQLQNSAVLHFGVSHAVLPYKIFRITEK